MTTDQIRRPYAVPWPIIVHMGTDNMVHYQAAKRSTCTAFWINQQAKTSEHSITPSLAVVERHLHCKLI